MNEVGIKRPILLIVICLSIGGAIDYFTNFNWLTTGLGLLAIFLLNGLIISIEDRQEGGFDYEENESQTSKENFRKACLIHLSFISLAIFCAIFSVWIRN